MLGLHCSLQAGLALQPKSVGLVWRSAANWRCLAFVKWTEWTLAVTLSRWQHYKHRPGIIIIIIIIITQMMLTVFVLAHQMDVSYSFILYYVIRQQKNIKTASRLHKPKTSTLSTHVICKKLIRNQTHKMIPHCLFDVSNTWMICHIVTRTDFFACHYGTNYI